jgi:hypothetical protein
MTMEQRATQAAPGRGLEAAASEATTRAREVAESAGEEGRALAQDAMAEGRELASTVRTQVTHVLDDARSELQAQADGEVRRAAEGLRQMGGQLQALAHGDAEHAGKASEFAEQAARNLQDFAGRIESVGYRGLLSDLEGFARRRPGTFLFGAAAVGLLSGRLLTAGAPGQQQTSSPMPQPGSEAALPPHYQSARADMSAMPATGRQTPVETEDGDARAERQDWT